MFILPWLLRSFQVPVTKTKYSDYITVVFPGLNRHKGGGWGESRPRESSVNKIARFHFFDNIYFFGGWGWGWGWRSTISYSPPPPSKEPMAKNLPLTDLYNKLFRKGEGGGGEAPSSKTPQVTVLK